VLIYFGRQLQSWVMAHVTQLLARKGVLFLGASETLWQIQNELEAVDLETCYCYRHRRSRNATGAMPLAAEVEAEEAARRRPAREPEERPAREQAAGERAAGETEPAPEPARMRLGRERAKPEREQPARKRPAEKPAWESDAHGTAVAGRPPGVAAGLPGAAAPATAAATGAPDARSAVEMLLAAAHELAANRPEGARQAVGEALAADPSEPAGHLLDGFLHDLGGGAEEAVASYRAALYLDPSLFQARLLLADCLLRLGRRDRAEHQFREVLAALEAGRGRPVAIFDGLPLPDRDRALRRCRQALNAAGGGSV
jgi:tetratricopeptide (TPR) repeat protein